MAPINTRKAAEVLGCSPSMVREYAVNKLLVPVTRSGERGRGQRLYFDRGEVEALRDGGAPAAKAYREAKAVVGGPKKKGRKQAVA